MGFITGALTDNPDRKLPLQRVMEMVARGNGEMAGQAQAKKTLTDQESQKSKMSVTISPNPTGDVPFVTIKNAPADLLNQTQESDVEQAYLAPKKSVERLFAGARRTEDSLRSYGFAPKTSDVQPSDVNSFSERYRARRELGGSVIGSAIMSGVTRGHTDARLVENLKNERAAANSATAQKYVNPLVDQELEAGRLASGMAGEQRQFAQQYLNARNQLLDQKNIMQAGSEDEFLSTAEKAMQEVGGFREGDRDLFAKAFRTNRVSFLTDRVKALSGEEGKTAIASYGDTPEEINRFVDEQGGIPNPTEFERNRIARVAKGLVAQKHDQVVKEVQKDRAALGSFQTFEEAKTALGIKLPAEKEAQLRADYKAARRAYVTADEKDRAGLQLTRGHIAALERGNQIAQQQLQQTQLGQSVAGGDELLAKLPADTAGLVKKIANYEMDLSKVTSMRGGQRERIASLVALYDPTFDMTQYGARNAVRRDFTSGKSANNIRSLNTAVKHLESLDRAGKKLDNSSLQLWNKIANTAITQTGDPRVTNFKTAANAVESEMASVFKNMGATDQEIKAWRENLNESQSPQQITGAIHTMIDLMGGRLAALDGQWTTNMGKPRDFAILSKSSKDILRKFGVNPDTMEAAGSAVPAGPVVSDPNEILKIFGKKH